MCVCVCWRRRKREKKKIKETNEGCREKVGKWEKEEKEQNYVVLAIQYKNGMWSIVQ